MNDKRDSDDELPTEGDEELLSDFSELFAEEETDEVSNSGDTNDTLDELDAFLDDFETEVEPPASPVAAQRGSAQDLGLDTEDLDLDVGLEGEVFAPEPRLDIDEELVADDQLSLGGSSDEAPSPLVVPQVKGESPQPPVAGQGEGAAPAPALTRNQRLGAIALLATAMVLSLAALWMGLGLSGQIDALNQSVGELQQRVQAQSRRGSITPQQNSGEQLMQLEERLNELAVIVEGPVGHLRESNQLALDAMNMRLERLERGQSQAVSAVTGPPSVTAVGKPLVQPPEAQPVAEEPPAAGGAPTDAAAERETGWVINLMSVTSARMANSELERLRKLGIRADKQTVEQDGKSWYRLRVTGFASYEGAKAYIDTVQQQTGVSSAWVGQE